MEASAKRKREDDADTNQPDAAGSSFQVTILHLTEKILLMDTNETVTVEELKTLG